MATSGDIDSDLTLEVSGNSVTPDKFLRSVSTFFAILNEVTREVSPRPGSVEWLVQVKSGSNLVGVDPRPGYDPAISTRVIKAISGGISLLEEQERIPVWFNEPALEALRGLGNVVGKTERDDTTIKIWAGKHPIRVTSRSVAHVNYFLVGAHQSHGSIEGTLLMDSVTWPIPFVVHERLWNRAIQCFIPDGLSSEALENFGKRVEVYGIIHYRGNGEPVSIKVDEIVAFPHADDIPSFRDVRGILRDTA